MEYSARDNDVLAADNWSRRDQNVSDERRACTVRIEETKLAPGGGEETTLKLRLQVFNYSAITMRLV